jgi:glycosyltransferase involved in cell wall biosynthesis
MKVLLINKRAPFEGRGAERVIWQIGKHFAKAGHLVRFFCPNPTGETSIPDIDGLDFHFVNTSGDATRGMIGFFLRGPFHYREAYASFDPDVVYDNASPFPFHFARVFGSAPIVNKVHAVYRSLAFQCKDHPLVKLGTIAGEETYRAFRGEYFVTNSESTMARLKKLVSVDKNKLVANPIGVDASSFECNIPQESDVVVSISKLAPRKRINDLLRAWQFVEQAFPEKTLVIAGSGPRARKLQSLRDELGLTSVDFLGFVSEQRKRELLNGAGVFASPTLYEGFGISNLEAMASGCAVVSSDTWGVRDYLEDGHNGIAVPTKSPHRFSEALREVLGDPDTRRCLAERGRSTAESFSMEESLERELDYLRAVVAGEPLDSSS